MSKPNQMKGLIGCWFPTPPQGCRLQRAVGRWEPSGSRDGPLILLFSLTQSVTILFQK